MYCSGPQLVIWGTDVVVSECKEKFQQMMRTFIPPAEELLDPTTPAHFNATEPLYLQKLEEVRKIPCIMQIISLFMFILGDETVHFEG